MADKNVGQPGGYKVKMRDNGDGSYTPYTLPAAGASAPIATVSEATPYDVVAANVDTLLLPLNEDRRGAMFFNDSDKYLYLKLGSAASATSFAVKIAPDGYFELPSPVFTGLIHGFWAAGPTGAARITELT
jgi:hypothetical protein